MPIPLTQAVLEQWLSIIPSGKFNVRDAWNDIGIESPEAKQYLRVALGRIESQGTHAVTPIASNGGGGNYRKLDLQAARIDWEAADPSNTIDLIFPFGEEEYVRIYPKSIIIVAGTKNAGKTAYLYNFIALNMRNHKIDLYNSETGPEQMNERFQPLNIPRPAPFDTFERFDNFADIIKPDHISVIDYLDMNSEVYLVGAEIDAIFRKLNHVAIIALQKPPPTVTYVKGIKKVYERDLAYGGGFTAKRAILYITMGASKLKLLYVKTPAQKGINPNNMTFSFEMDDDGTHFKNVQRSYGDD